MKAKLTLNNPLWQTPERRAILDKAVQESGAELEAAIKQKILTGPKSGKTYRRGAIKKRVAQKDLKFYRSDKRVFKRTFSGLYAEKTTVGYQFHRASAPGESPSSDTGQLAGSVRARKIGFLSVKVATGVRYARALDQGAVFSGRNKRTKIVGPVRNREIKPRPFFASTAQEFRSKFKQNVADVIRENS